MAFCPTLVPLLPGRLTSCLMDDLPWNFGYPVTYSISRFIKSKFRNSEKDVRQRWFLKNTVHVVSMFPLPWSQCARVGLGRTVGKTSGCFDDRTWVLSVLLYWCLCCAVQDYPPVPVIGVFSRSCGRPSPRFRP